MHLDLQFPIASIAVLSYNTGTLLLVRLLLIARLSHLSLLAKQGLAQRPGSAALSAGLATALTTALATALVERERVRPLGTLVEHLMREALSGHQGASETTKGNQRCFERLELSEHQSESTKVNQRPSTVIRGAR